MGNEGLRSVFALEGETAGNELELFVRCGPPETIESISEDVLSTLSCRTPALGPIVRGGKLVKEAGELCSAPSSRTPESPAREVAEAEEGGPLLGLPGAIC